MTTLVILIVVAVIAAQVYFFMNNLKRMKEFKNIFSSPNSYKIIKDDESGFVTGISGSGNQIFQEIKSSINKYLGNNKGSIIDFQLLKDAVDRHCDSVEDDINVQTPVPLYCGLAGTMLGVIIGLASLLFTNSIYSLMTGSTTGATASGAATGVSDLLSGVALAMIASVCGIGLTTCNSLLFKKYKLEQEKGKNTFLAWMQSKLLPELPSDTSEVMAKLVNGLNKFNREFTRNISILGSTFDAVNHSYQTQAEIIKMVHDMDVEKLAAANVRVLHRLESCTEKLDEFNEYLDKLDEFNFQFSRQAETQEIFKNISEYFNKSKAYIASDVAAADNTLQIAMGQLRDHSSDSINELKGQMTALSEAFMRMISEEKQSFEEFSQSLRSQFDHNMNQLPNISKQLDAIAAIPKQLEGISSRMSQANLQLERNMERALEKASRRNEFVGNGSSLGFPNSLRNWIIALLSVIALSCITNTCFNIFRTNRNAPTEQTESVPADTIATDSADSTEMKDAIPAANQRLDSTSSVLNPTQGNQPSQSELNSQG